MKQFDDWNRQKQGIHDSEQHVFFHEREIWFCKLGVNVGFEQDGKGKDFLRPIIIIRKINNKVFYGVPLTSIEKEGKYYFKISDFNNRKNWAILTQMKLYDSKRLEYKIGVLNKIEFEELKKAIKLIL